MYSALLAIIYISFISLGLPDGLLGAGWPEMYPALGVPVSFAGIISAIISVGTVISALMSDRLTHALGAGRVTAFSVLMTAAALLGFSLSGSFIALCLWAVPYGVGAGCVDAALNNYVAVHYESRHMSWLHCMWGVGAAAGPHIMGLALSAARGWEAGYRYVAVIQFVLTAALFISLPLWRRAENPDAPDAGKPSERTPMPELLRIPGVRATLLAFFCYLVIESSSGLWAASCLVLRWGLDEAAAARIAGLFYLGITAGRAISGFITMRLGDDAMIRLGSGIILCGALGLILPYVATAAAGFGLLGLGCAPVYPAIIHSTPARFGAERSQGIIGLEMASAYVGSLLGPPAFGLIANHISPALLPGYLLCALVVMAIAHRAMPGDNAGLRPGGQGPWPAR